MADKNFTIPHLVWVGCTAKETLWRCRRGTVEISSASAEEIESASLNADDELLAALVVEVDRRRGICGMVVPQIYI